MAFSLRKAATLSKTTFMSGLQCRKRIWLEIHRPTQPKNINFTQQRIMRQGHEVGYYAQQQFPEGQLIESFGEKALKETQLSLEGGATCLFEPAFVFDDILVRCDILLKNPDHTWTLIEVKSSTRVKDEHYWDVSIQAYVLKGVGLDVKRVVLMHINNQDCYYPDLSNLFVLQDITSSLTSRLSQVAKYKGNFIKLLAGARAPQQTIGRHCHTPNPCPFQEHCWQQVSETSIFTIPRLNWDKKVALVTQGIFEIADLPTSVELSPTQQNYVETVLNQEPHIDREAISTCLAELTYPIHFLDFETYSSAIPKFEGMKPFEQLPFQYSCHSLQADGQVSHREFLHTEDSDPRLPLVRSLLSQIGPSGSVVVYQKSFEAMVLKRLARTFPMYQAALLSICDRLWDQQDIFKHHYRDPAFEGKTSIKKVLPVMVPTLSYADLDIQQGDEAQSVWGIMLQTANQADKQLFCKSLKAYCQLDTQAMLEIHQVLAQLCQASPE